MQKQTTHAAEFQQRSGGGPPKLSEETLSDLKGDHTCYGVDKENWLTANQEVYQWKQPDINSYDNPLNP